jgi:CBS domain-containing protein
LEELVFREVLNPKDGGSKRIADCDGLLHKTFISIHVLLEIMATVKDLMTKRTLTIDSQDTVFEAAQLMSRKGVGDLIVVDNEMPVGIVTERDFVRRLVAKGRPFDTKVSDVMTKPLITISPDASIKEAARKMVKHGIRRLPVLKDHKLMGILVVSDFARHLGKKTLTEGILEAIWRQPINQG